MSVSYTCPNAACGVTLKTPNRVAPGKRVKCPKCGEFFVPEPEGAAAPAAAPAAGGGGTLKFADEDPAKKPAAAGPPVPKPQHDDDDEDAESVKRGYGVVKETEEELEEGKKSKVKFGEVQDRFKKSARGPAMALLVTPSNLLVLEGLLTAIFGLCLFLWGMWPLVFNDGPAADEELEEAIVGMLMGTVSFGWGAAICYGASQMQELASYNWAMVGACMGVVPLLVGAFAIVMLQNPKVKAGFAESEGGPDDDEDDDPDKAKKDDDDGGGGGKAKKKAKDEDDEDDEDEKPKKKTKGKKVKTRGDEDGEDEDEKPTKDKKKAKARRKDADEDDEDD